MKSSKGTYRFLLPLKLIVILALISQSNSQFTSIMYYTPEAFNDYGNIFAFTNHAVFCPSTHVLSFWQLLRKGNYISVQYLCIKGLAVLEEQSELYTPWNSTNNNKFESLNYLDRHNVICPSDMALNGFQLERNGNSVRFRYKCNKVKYSSQNSWATDYLRSGTGEIQGLSVIQVRVADVNSNMQALTGFKMNVRYVNQWCTFLCSSFQDISFNIYYDILRNITKDNIDG